MYRETAGLVMYGQLGKDSILMKLGRRAGSCDLR